MDWILQHWDDLVGIVFGVISVASAIVYLTPSQTDDEVVAKIRSVLERLALNAPRTRPPGIYDSPHPPPPGAPPSTFYRRPPGSMALLLCGLTAAALLSACAPPPLSSLTQPEAVQLAQVCRQAGAALQDAADRRDGGSLTAEQAAAVDRLASAAKRPCGRQDAAVPRDVDRVAEALDDATGALQ